jgi:hypothetical protein
VVVVVEEGREEGGGGVVDGGNCDRLGVEMSDVTQRVCTYRQKKTSPEIMSFPKATLPTKKLHRYYVHLRPFPRSHYFPKVTLPTNLLGQ